MEPQTPSIRTAFEHALDLDSDAERRAYLDRVGAQTPELRRKVEALLQAYEEAGSFLEPGAPALDSTVAEEPAPVALGSALGPYKLLEQIGEGGFGAVYRAEQTHPVRREVALKVLKPGMDSKQVLARFDAERQALALMDHPHIAKVLDAGTADTGQPYFVMELVRGIPVTGYCDRHRLTARQRLELFVDVCRAVQHAHAKGIIHRDLKPSNVLVTLHDGSPVAKVIDFGIAKATRGRLTERTLFTGIAQVIGTPLYMSPEQLDLSGLDIDTRADVYALGVLLYELLTGTTPFDPGRLREVGFDELRRIVREEDPPRPSARVAALGRAADRASADRQGDPRRRGQRFRGELDWVVMKALEKDRNRRYETASALADDVQRYLDDEPVQACPPSPGYRLRKWARRHKAAVWSAGVVTAVTLAALATSLGFITAAYRSEAEQHRKAVVNLHRALDAVEQMLTHVGEERLQDVPQMEHVRRELLEDALRFYRQFLEEESDDPAVRLATGRACRVAADIYRMLGEQDRALGHYDRAERLLTRHGPTGPDDAYQLALVHRNRGRLFHDLGRFEESREGFERALQLLGPPAADHPDEPRYRKDLAAAHRDLANVLPRLDRPREESLQAHREAESLLEELAEEFPEDPDYRYQLALVHRDRGVLAYHHGRIQEIEGPARKSLGYFEGLLAEAPKKAAYRRDRVKVLTLLAASLMYTDRPEEAEPFLIRARDAHAGLAADFPQVPVYQYQLAGSHHNLSHLQQMLGRFDEAEAGFRLALERYEELVEKYPEQVNYHRDRANTVMWLGGCLMLAGRLADGEKELSRAVDLYRELADEFDTVPEYKVQLAGAHSNLGECLHRQGNDAGAEEQYRLALPILERLTAKHPDEPQYLRDLANTHLPLGVALAAQGRGGEADEALREALPRWRGLVDRFPEMSDYRKGLATTLARLGNHAAAAKEAEELLRRSSDRAQGCYLAGCILSRCVSAAGKDPHAPEGERASLAGAYAERALAYLREAVDRRSYSAALMKHEPDLQPLRDRPEFRELLGEGKPPPEGSVLPHPGR